MRAEHWMLLAVMGVIFTGLLLLSLLSSNRSKAYHWTLRIACSALLLWISANLGGIGLNSVNLILLTCFGIPGYAAMSILSKL